MQRPNKVYVCSVCEQTHASYDDACECCPPEVWEMYQCPVCDETHDTESAAESCCVGDSDEDFSTGQYRIYPRDLTINPDRYIEQFILMNKYVD